MAPYYFLYLLPCLMSMVLTLTIIRPDLSQDLWLSILGVIERRRAWMLDRKSRQLETKMKKYWVIDMRKLR